MICAPVWGIRASSNSTRLLADGQHLYRANEFLAASNQIRIPHPKAREWGVQGVYRGKGGVWMLVFDEQGVKNNYSSYNHDWFNDRSEMSDEEITRWVGVAERATAAFAVIHGGEWDPWVGEDEGEGEEEY